MRPALGELLVLADERGHGRGEADRRRRASRSSEAASRSDAELVARALRLGRDAPVLAELASPSNRPKTVCVLPTSTASSIMRPRAYRADSSVVVARERLADPLGERLGGERRLVALAAQLLDRDVARGVDLGARDHPRRAVLVPDPDVLHLQVEERVARLRHVLEVELVAEVRRVLREHAVAEEAEDGRVLLLERELELGLVLVELVEVGHQAVSVAPRAGPRPGPGPGRRGRGRARRAARGRTRARAGAGAGRARPGSSTTSSP